MTVGSPQELSAREGEILRLVTTGVTNQQIALALHISSNTVKVHLRNIFAKLGVESRTEASMVAVRLGMVPVGRPAMPAATMVSLDPATPVALNRQLTGWRWPASPLQSLAAGLALLVVLATAVWPQTQAGSAVGENRLLDAPRASTVPTELATASRWQPRALMPTPRGRFAQAQVNGLIYVIGGLTDGDWAAQTEVYDPQEDRWTRLSRKPVAVANIGAAAVKGKIYVPGGLDEHNSIRDLVEVYDPATDTWGRTTPLPAPMCAYAIASVADGFFVLGGWDGRHYLNTAYYYDVATDTWRSQPPLGTARSLCAAAALDGRVYLVGGYDGTTEYSNCEVFDPALVTEGKDPWRTLSPMTMARAGHAMAISHGGLYVVGGGWDGTVTYNERYDVVNDVWSRFETPLTGEWRSLGLTPVVMRDGEYVYAIGGWSGRYLGVVQVYPTFYRVFLP